MKYSPAKVLELQSRSINHAAVPKPEKDFAREVTKPAKTISVNYIILKSEKKELFKNNLDSIMAKENIENIFKKLLCVTKTKMNRLAKGGGVCYV